MNKDLYEAQKDLLESTFSKAMAYTNTVILAGYASFFGIWNFTKPQLTNNQILWSAVLMSVSLIAFVLFEIYGMFYRSKSLLGLANVVNNQETFNKKLLEHKEKEQTRSIVHGRIWLFVFPVSVISGVSAAGILLWAFIAQLFQAYG